jgi:hypothetical protein
MDRAALLLGALVLASPVQAKAPIASPSGNYGNVEQNDETGDLLGMEARFFEQAGQPMVEFVWCQGWCNDVYVMPVIRGDHGFAFHYSERADVGGDLEYHFVAWPAGKRLKVGAWQGREPLDEGRPQLLKRLDKPFAIPFAKANGAH